MEDSNGPVHPTPEEERSITPESTVALGVSSNSPPSQAQGDGSEVIYNGVTENNSVTVATSTHLEDDAESNNTSEKKLSNGENTPSSSKQSSNLTNMSGVNKRNKQLSNRTIGTSKNIPMMGYQILPIIPHPVLFPVMPKNQYGYQPSLQASQDPEPLSTTNLYIKGLPENCTDDDLEEMCKQYGKIVSTKAILDKKTGICKGYGFVDFQDPVDANKAVDSLQTNGVQAQFAKLQEQDPTNLYMSNLPKNFTEKHLEQLLTPYGSIISSRILRDLGGSSRGVGFVRLDSHENCQLAIQKLASTTFPGCSGEPLNIKFADGSTNKRKIQGNWKDMDIMGWKDYGVQDQYVYDVPPPVLAPNSYVGSRLMSHNYMPGSPYIQHQSSQVPTGYQVPAPGTSQVSSPSWANQYYLPPGAAGNMNGGDHNIHNISSQLNSLQLSSQNGSTSTRPGSGNSGHTPNSLPPTHTAQYTQQPPGWTIRLSHPPHYIQQHT